jgi:hypothetical protein
VGISKKFEMRNYFSWISDAVPKLIDCALTRTVLEQALAVFQAKALQNCIFGTASSVIYNDRSVMKKQPGQDRNYEETDNSNGMTITPKTPFSRGRIF